MNVSKTGAIISISKMIDDKEKTIKFDLSKRLWIGLKGNYVKFTSVKSFFTYYDINEFLNNLQTEPQLQYIKLIIKDIARSNHDISNIGTIFERWALDYKSSEEWYTKGISFLSDYNISYFGFGKKQLKYISMFCKFNIDYYTMLIYKENASIIEKMMDIHNKHDISFILNNLNLHDFRKITVLIETYNCSLIDLNKALYYYHHEEYLTFNNSLEYLKDYINMQHTIITNVVNKNNIKFREIRYEKYPKYIYSVHDRVSVIYDELNESEKYNYSIINNINSALSYNDKIYSITNIENYESLILEATILRHCVKSYARNLSENIKNQIVCLRLSNDIKHPLVTVEIMDKDIIQARGYANRGLKFVEFLFLKKYAKHHGLKLITNNIPHDIPLNVKNKNLSFDKFIKTEEYLGDLYEPEI